MRSLLRPNWLVASLLMLGGCTDGGISQYDHRTRRTRSIEPWPETFLGHGAGQARYRFQWTAPILISVHDPRKLYHAANVLFRSLDAGERWDIVSPDLTRQIAEAGVDIADAWRKLPPVYSQNTVGELKPGAKIKAVGS